MEHLILKIGLTIISLLSFSFASAYDFEVNGIYYDILSPTDLTCEVVASPDKYSGDIVIPEKVTYNNRQLSVIAISGSLLAPKLGAFYCCESLISVSLPESVNEIPAWSFYYCNSLKKIFFPKALTFIGQSAFYACKSLTSLVFYNKLEEIQSSAFADCSALESVSFSNNSSLISIGTYAFRNCKSLKSFDFPKGLRTIGENAFFNCSSLTSIVLPDSLTEMESGAFYGCSSLGSFDLPNKLELIGSSAFYNCSTIKSIKIPTTVKSIGPLAFNGCSALVSIELNDNIKILDYGTFCGCESLSKLTIPGNITTLGFCYNQSGNDELFYNCVNLKELDLEYSPYTLEARFSYSIGSNTSSGGTTLDFGWNTRSSLGVVTHFPLPLEKVTIDRKLQNIIKLDSLRHYTIGEHVMDNQVYLSSSNNLETITSLAKIPPTGMNRLTNIQYTQVIVKVPNESLEAYKNADGWKNFWNIEGMATSGISDVHSDYVSKVYIVYNLQGMLVLKTVNREELMQLPTGLYIVNGKKVFIR